MTYIPNPEDTSGITLPPEVAEMAEKIARHVHETWARKRYDEGWRYGPVRDDAARLTPCMVPYDELPESEKEYDRATALETLKIILKHIKS